jgi:uncharacterized protein YukE
MNLPGNPSTSRTLALVLIVFALIGTEFSYHFTLESRFDAIEDKLQQNTLAIQQFQGSIDSISSSKSETLAELNKEVVGLESSFGPLGKATQAQTDSLSQLHQQIATLQQAQDDQLNAQKKLFGSVAQLEKSHLKVIMSPAPVPIAPAVAAPAPEATAAPVPTTVAPAPIAAPATTAAPTHSSVPSQHPPSTAAVIRPTGPSNHDSIDLRTDEDALPSPGMMATHQVDVSEQDNFRSVRALPVGASLSSQK